MSLFDILIQGSNNKGFFMQISTVIRQLKRVTSLTKITCPIRWSDIIHIIRIEQKHRGSIKCHNKQ